MRSKLGFSQEKQAHRHSASKQGKVELEAPWGGIKGSLLMWENVVAIGKVNPFVKEDECVQNI